MGKLKVLHTITRLGVGGAAENTILCAALLDKEKYDVDVASGYEPGSEGNMLEEAKKLGVVPYTFNNLVREISPLKDYLHYREMCKFLKEKKYDVIHTHSSKAGILHRLAARTAKTPIIVHTVHGWSYHDRMSNAVKKFYVVMEKYCEKFTDKMITVTDFDIQKGLDEGIGKRENYTTIHSAIDIKKYETPLRSPATVRAELGIDDSKLVIGTVSRMVKQKAPLDYMELAKNLCAKYPQLVFIFVGEGYLRPEIEDYLKENKLTDKVKLPGVRHDVPDFLHIFDIFVLSSLWEGLPRVFSQAMAARLPICATRVNGAPEAIADKVNGFLVDPGNVGQMEEVVIKLIESKELRQQMGQEGHKRVDPAFCVYNMVAQIGKVYEKIIPQKSQLND